MREDVDRRPGRDVEDRRGLRPKHTLGVVAVGVVALVVVYFALHTLASIVIGLVEAVIVIAVVAALVWLVFGRRRRH